MDLNLTGKRAVVTGASKGIGLAITRALAAEGVTVIAAARTVTTELSDLAARTATAGSSRQAPHMVAPDAPDQAPHPVTPDAPGQAPHPVTPDAPGQAPHPVTPDAPGPAAVHPVRVDLSTPDGPARLIETAVATLGGLDILINNVGAVRPRTGGFLSVTDEDWAETLTINFLAAVRTTRSALPHLIESGHATIVTVNSVNARLPDPLVIDYSAAKAALASFSKSLSKEVARHGIRVTTVSPGPVTTGLWLGPDGVAATVAREVGTTPDGAAATPEEVADTAASGAATGRFTEPDEVADVVLLLASNRAANLTGTDVVIDGGLLTTL